MVAAVKFYNFSHYLCTKNVNLNSDTLKVILTNTAPVVTNSVYADVSAGELATANGYTNGGGTVSGVSSSNSLGTESVAGSAFTWTASGTVGPFQYAILRDTTFDCLIEWWDYGSHVTMASADTFTWTPTGSVILQLTY
jgi:hypothetical protein